VFLEGMKEMEGVHDNITLSKQVKHIVANEAMNDDELVKDDNCIFFKERPTKDVESEFTSIFSSKKNLFHHKMKV
jgi:hypothetical protein